MLNLYVGWTMAEKVVYTWWQKTSLLQRANGENTVCCREKHACGQMQNLASTMKGFLP